MRTTLVLGVALLSAVFTAVASREGVAAPMRERGPLVLTAFVQSGRTDLFRNGVLEFRFSTPLRRGSVDQRTLQINEITPQGSKPAEGSRILSGNVVVFDPRRSQANLDAARRWNSTFVEADRLPSERELMRHFGVGRPSVREALLHLHRMGLVEVGSGERARVTRPTPQSVIDALSGPARHMIAAPGGVQNFQNAPRPTVWTVIPVASPSMASATRSRRPLFNACSAGASHSFSTASSVSRSARIVSRASGTARTTASGMAAICASAASSDGCGCRPASRIRASATGSLLAPRLSTGRTQAAAPPPQR